MLSKKVDLSTKKKSETDHTTTYGRRYFDQPVPKYTMPEEGMPASAAYQLIRDELNLDGNPALNLASFVTTWMEPEANQLIAESLDKNFVDNDEYPQTTIIQERVVNMLARLWNAPEGCESIGTATIGSSEAIMLGPGESAEKPRGNRSIIPMSSWGRTSTRYGRNSPATSTWN